MHGARTDQATAPHSPTPPPSPPPAAQQRPSRLSNTTAVSRASGWNTANHRHIPWGPGTGHATVHLLVLALQRPVHDGLLADIRDVEPDHELHRRHDFSCAEWRWGPARGRAQRPRDREGGAQQWPGRRVWVTTAQTKSGGGGGLSARPPGLITAPNLALPCVSDAVEGKGPQRRLPKRLGAVTVGYKCHWGWHLPSGGQWLGALEGGGIPHPISMHPCPPPPNTPPHPQDAWVPRMATLLRRTEHRAPRNSSHK